MPEARTGFFRFEAKIIGRRGKDKSGKPIPGKTVSVVAKAAYRTALKLHDERQDRTYNYRSRAQEVVHTEIVSPEDRPSWLEPPQPGEPDLRHERLWNEVEKREKRVDSQLAREFVISLPVELSREDQIEAVRQWCHQEVAAHGYVADFAIHHSHDGSNPHVHALCTLRPFEGEGFGNKPDMTGKFLDRGQVGRGAKSELEGWRASWEAVCNEALERAGSDVRVDRRSLEDRGIDREPEPKIGPEAIAMQRRGAEEDPRRVRDARQVQMQNSLRENIRAVEGPGETAAPEATATPWSARLQSGLSHAWGEFRELLRDESSGVRPPQEKQQDVPGPADARDMQEIPRMRPAAPRLDQLPLDLEPER